jgi:ankyrin repeat protein
MKLNSNYLLALFLGISLSVANANQLSPTQLNTKLFYACKGGFIQTAEQLIKSGANVNSTQASRETPLHAAASTGKLNIIKMLKRKGAKPNPRTRTGWVPLHHAVRFGHIHVVNYLLSSGVPLYIRTHQGKSVFDLAKATKNQRMINLLEQWKKRPRR